MWKLKTDSSCENATSNLEQMFFQHRGMERLSREKVEDLENRNRHNNLWFIGIPESALGDNLLTLLAVNLPKVLNLDMQQDTSMIKHAHRLGTPKLLQNTNARPLLVIARYLNWCINEKILQAYRWQNTLKVGDHKLLIFHDFSATLSQKRKAFSLVYKYLHDNAIKFQLIYHATLKVQWERKQLAFDDSSTAPRHFNIRNEDNPG